MKKAIKHTVKKGPSAGSKSTASSSKKQAGYKEEVFTTAKNKKLIRKAMLPKAKQKTQQVPED